MPDDKSSCNEPECFKLEERVFGVRRPGKATLDKWAAKGWLSQNGICKFPRDAEAHPSGIRSDFPIKYFKNATEDQIFQALMKGYIRFADGNGNYYTLEEYIKKYPEYPDPEIILRVEGRFPPDPSKYHEISEKDAKYVFRPRM